MIASSMSQAHYSRGRCSNESPFRNDALLAIEQSTEPLASGPAARLSDLFLRIPECTSKETIDQAAVDFAFMNSKASRNRLIKVGYQPI